MQRNIMEYNIEQIEKRNEKNNSSKAHLKEVPESKLASLDYTIIKICFLTLDLYV